MGWYLAAAACIALCIGLYWFTQQNKAIPAQPTAQQVPKRFPVTDKAVLVLADGRIVSLDSAVKIQREGITVLNGELHYTSAGALDTGYNTVKVPAGQQLKIVLADGSAVWLNAETTLRYAVNFDSHPRKVTLTGEAFFDVHHNPSKPFVVTSNRQDVTVSAPSLM
jgi:transmembrane sensor